MGNPSRCPECNRFGSADLGGYCKACYREPEKPYVKPDVFAKIESEFKKNPTVVRGAYLEVGKKPGELITKEEAKRIYQIILRRKPVKRTGHVVKGESPMEKYGYSFGEVKEDYGIIKEVVDYERLE